MPILAVAAIAAGAAVATGVVAATTVGLVGLATTVVGKVTKSKELLQIGSGMSLGAGIASVASSVFGGATAAGAGAAEAGAAGSVENTISSADLAGIDSAAGGVGGAAAATPGLGIEEAVSGAAGATGGLGEAAGAKSGGTGGLLGSSPQASFPLSNTPQASLSPDAAQVPGSSLAGVPGATGPIAPPPATDANSISQWWSKQPESIKNRILQVGGQAAGGLFEGWSNEQKMALEREKLNLEKQKFNTAQSNASAQPVVRFAPYTPPSGGLLNSPRG